MAAASSSPPWLWFTSLPPAERAAALGIDDKSWLLLFEDVYTKTRDADQTALFEWDYLEHLHATFARSKGKQQRKGKVVALPPIDSIAETEERCHMTGEEAGEQLEQWLVAGIDLLSRVRLLPTRGGEAWESLTLDERWLSRPQELLDLVLRASGGRFLQAAPAGRCGGRLQSSSVPWLREAEVIHVGVLLAGRVEAALWAAYAARQSTPAPGGAVREAQLLSSRLQAAVRAEPELPPKVREVTVGNGRYGRYGRYR